MQTMRRAGRAAVAVAAVAAILAACSSGGAATTAPTVAPTTGATTGAAALTLQLKQDATLGAFVTGKDGMTLYVFTNDTAGKSTCSGNCAGSWPPLTVASASDVTAGAGVTGTIAAITRDDGTLQVTLGGMPLYYFAGDTAAGQTKGQGLNGKWYVSSPAGTAVTGTAATSAPATMAPPAGTTAPGSSKCSGPTCY